jgi:hypothetical protein
MSILNTYTNIAAKEVLNKNTVHDFPISDLSYNNILLMQEVFNTYAKISMRMLPNIDKNGRLSIEPRMGTTDYSIRSANAKLNSRFTEERLAYRKPMAAATPTSVSVGGGADGQLLARLIALEKRVTILENEK